MAPRAARASRVTPAPAPTADTVLATLRKLGKPATAAIYARHGVKGACYGVPYAALGTLVKSLPVDQGLALALWKSGVHDARVLATRLADPAVITTRELDAFLRDTDDYVLCDAIGALAARTPHAGALALRWIGSRDEWVAAAGYDVVAALAVRGALDAATGKRVIAGIEHGIRKAKNRTRHSMNGALIALGGAIPGLAEPALAAAHAIGTVEVDHGQTGCKTPAAGPYIERMRAHRGKPNAKLNAKLSTPKLNAKPNAKLSAKLNAKLKRASADAVRTQSPKRATAH